MTQTISYTTPDEAERVSWAARLQQLSALAGLVLVVVLFSALRPETFPTVRNLTLMLTQSAVVAIAALGMTMVIISGGIDLSVGATIALVTMIVPDLLNGPSPWLLHMRSGWLKDLLLMVTQLVQASPLLAALIGVAAGGVCGLVIGLLVTRFRLLPFIVTLGTWSAYRGIAKGIGHEKGIYTRTTWINDLMIKPSGAMRWTMLAPSVWILIVLSLFVAGVMRYTKFGRHIFAVGSNEQTARLCGIRVDRVKILVYVFSGLLAGCAGVLQFSYNSKGDPTTAMGMELNIIAAVVIGGASLNGGQGSILGTLIGAAIMCVLSNGCTKLGLLNWVQEIITGTIIILASILDRLQHRRGD